jgi:3-oxoacyl-[acyl-carrier-protein] synthase-1
VGPGEAGPGLDVRALGLAIEPAPLGSETPLRADGLTKAFGTALTAAGLEMRQIGYRLSTLSGEQYWFKEAELATMRLLRGRHEFMEFLHPADSIGETGAAALPCALGFALTAADKGWAPGDPVLAFTSNDEGRRAALVLSASGAD